MNTPVDKLLAALKIVSPYSTLEEKTKEFAKQYIKNHNYPPVHENNLIAIIKDAKKPDEMLTKLLEYTKTFGLVL